MNVLAPKMNPSDKQYSSNNTQSMPQNQDLLDLLGGLDLSTTTATTPTLFTDNLNSTNGNILSALSPVSPITANILSNNLFDDLTSHTTTTANTTPTTGNKITALDKDGLNVTLVPNKIADGSLHVVMIATNNSPATLEQYLFQAAVPKSFQMQMSLPSGAVLAPGATISQEMRLTSSTKVCLGIRSVALM